MEKRISTLLAVLISVSLLLVGCSTGDSTATNNTEKEITVTDTLGRTVTVPSDAQRFVAIGPGCLRLYCYVGDVSKIVGVEQMEVTSGVTGRPYARANEELLQLPLIGPGGPGNAPDPEKILEVNPDVILLFIIRTSHP